METHHHEWILTNKLGSYALGTGNLINQRKYHGLLIASDKNFQRNHLVAGIEEEIEWRGQILYLDSNNYSNCIYPEGFLCLVKPWLRPYPIFLYSAIDHQNDILIRKELMFDELTNTIMVKYTNLGHHKLHFTLRPKFTMILHHELNEPGSLDQEYYETSISNDDKKCQFQINRPNKRLSVFGSLYEGNADEIRNVYAKVFYPWEVMSGYPGIGDQISLVELNFTLSPGEFNYLLLSDKEITDLSETIKSIEKRYADLPKPKDYPAAPDNDDMLLASLDFDDNQLFSYDEYLRLLDFALQDFLTDGDIVAGYPYYGAWGRDTMIVLNALLHKQATLDIVEKVLENYGREIKGGLIPNMRYESGRETNYDTIDATLWYLILLWKLGKKKQDKVFWKDSVQKSENIIKSILTNTSYPFFIRSDGLIELKSEFSHATWMDVRIDGKALTPRNGAPVEINALWYNAVCSYLEICSEYGKAAGIKYAPLEQISDMKVVIFNSFQKFWVDGYLADRLIENKPVVEIRPNALIALSLPWELLDKEKMEKVWQRAYEELYTPYGIRTLSPMDYRFRKKYYGNQQERDLSYHNGAVWAWLLGAFCGLFVKIYRDKLQDAELAEKLSEFVSTFRNSYQRGHIASLAEVWDGEHPHFPKGAPALAISVAALFNIETFIATLRGGK
jgi:glycogen debranching enzyme